MTAVVETLRENRRTVPDGTSDEHVQRRRWWVLAVLCIFALVVVIDNTILNVVLPTMQREPHASQS